MLLIHPLIQLSAILLSLYVAGLGLQRFRFKHLGRRVPFKWKRHVRLGLVALPIIFGGMLLGMAMVRWYWHSFLLTGTHGLVGLIIVPFVLFGLGSGLYMNSRKKKRRLLPLAHGLNNFILLGLAFSQVITGWQVLSLFVLGL